ncbi:filamentous hemagglutinin N-terminal domain-containing protein [Microcoleus sp. FACHB-SPT15]|uniref:two-partner secretion domain-containing protein n=1 Tax=Microcoleus sp. FACHB-SPT15 TaxID=2692830 RepID=UPI00178047C6|nr:filamentous hemagglutinin N-terminal domain-containing protein [Microcoleus sp. FACHB-SPT15]MBD1805467.1 filamentous hemagglutinin N-terminal domain-containing protein [Microcoleus sp. FACHB-SPT15]
MKLTQSLSDTAHNEAKCEVLSKHSTFERTRWRLLEVTTALFLSLIPSGNAVLAQITPDATLGDESSTIQRNVLINGLPSDQIDGGAIRGTNLFHSFLEFNVTTGQGAYFTNPAEIKNIFSRVTGDHPSNIFGTLGVLGDANLLLLNPNGIIFGQTASLDLKGSFLATTANSVDFADGTQFNASSPQTSPLLTVNVPVGLGFGTTSGEILVQGSNLRMSPGKTLTLVGGNVTLQGGNLIAPAGRVELGSIAGSDFVNLTSIPKGWDLDYRGVQNFQDIQLSQGTSVNTSGEGGGAIQVQGRNVTLDGGSRLLSNTLGSQPGEGIQINAIESVQITGLGTYVADAIPFAFGDFDPFELRNGIFTLSEGSGKAGDITINTRQFTATNGAFVASYTFKSGRAGDLTLNVSDAVNLSATGIFTLAGQEATGEEGNLLAIDTAQLVMEDNAIISTTTFGSRQGGNLRIFASDSIDLISATPLTLDNGVSLQTAIVANTIGDGNSGNALISTQRLTLQNGAVIQAGTAGGGLGGSLVVNATESVRLTGSALNGTFPSSLDVSTISSGQGGNLEITTGNLVIEDGAGLLVASSGDASGMAGKIDVVANSISLDRGTITAAAEGNEGGNITLQSQNLQLRNQSQITATAELGSQGGNIVIDTDTLVALENSDITANAPQGSGGRITVNAQAIFGTEFREALTSESDITAFGKTPELSGIVELNTPDVNVQGDLNQLNANFIDTEQAIASSCLARRNVEQGSFTVTGTGGLPQNPYEAISGQYQLSTVQGLQPLPQQQASSPIPNPSSPPPTSWKLGDPIQEAQGMTVTRDGRIIVGTMPQLVATAQPQDLICNSSVQATEN